MWAVAIRVFPRLASSAKRSCASRFPLIRRFLSHLRVSPLRLIRVEIAIPQTKLEDRDRPTTALRLHHSWHAPGRTRNLAQAPAATPGEHVYSIHHKQ